MKNALFLLTAAVALVAQAEWRTVGTVQVADSVTLAQGLVKLGEFTGNAMLGMMAAGALNDLPGTVAFGPARKGAATLYPFFVENGRNAVALLYPVLITKEAFLGKYSDAIESNGLIRVTCPVFGQVKSVNYVAFTPDGKWAGISDNPRQARLAIREVETAERPLDGDMIKVRILRNGIDEFLKGGEQELDENIRDAFSQLGGILLGVRVSDRGLDLRGAVKVNEGTEFAKLGQKPLADSPLAFAGRDSVAASAWAPDSGQIASVEHWNEIKALVEKTGFRLDWLEFVSNNAEAKLTADLTKLAMYMKTLKENDDGKTLDKVIEAVKEYGIKTGGEKFRARGPAVNFAFALKGYDGKFLPAQRFAYTLPESAEKKPFAVGFFSLYSFMRTFLPVTLKMSPETYSGLETVIATLPEEGEGGMAYMAWSDHGMVRYFLRIGADEFKSVAAGFAAFMGMSAKGSVASDEDPEETDADDF